MQDAWVYYLLIVAALVVLVVTNYWIVSLNKEVLNKFALLEAKMLHFDKQHSKIIENNTRVIDKLDTHLDRLNDSQNNSTNKLSELKGTVETGIATLKAEIARK